MDCKHIWRRHIQNGFPSEAAPDELLTLLHRRFGALPRALKECRVCKQVRMQPKATKNRLAFDVYVSMAALQTEEPLEVVSERNPGYGQLVEIRFAGSAGAADR